MLDSLIDSQKEMLMSGAMKDNETNWQRNKKTVATQGMERFDTWLDAKTLSIKKCVDVDL